MIAAKIRHLGHAEQRKRRRDLVQQDVGRPRHSALATGHQPVEVGASHQCRRRPERHGRDDVAARPDAAVDVDLCPVGDGVDHRGQRLQRCDGPVELASAMVRHHDAVRSRVDDGPGIGGGEDALDHERSVPDGAEPRQVGDRRGRVEQAAGQLGDGPLEAGERRELERLGGEQVEPPGGMQRAFSEGLQRQGRRDGQAVAHVPQARPGDGVSTVSTSAS